MAARHISSAGEAESKSSEVISKASERQKKETSEEAGAESWHPQTGSREGASNEPKPGSNLETEAEKRHLTDMPEASSNRGHRRRDTEL
ncbi:hypothetical protein VC83_02930 [Pseudogymnoascus destructans]|uniref:Uncharacterized protein n=1 Tax=Pseudogymnoascus destructans TaxID=655981 RepID=A0A177AFM5_9PEZI|nr:uncharacterized protein VC83_02930 [Pseudogymnoascus destructans]OAF59973.1 hypothetical protein VC83_02930 [Pseudogymnoascus destructans]